MPRRPRKSKPKPLDSQPVDVPQAADALVASAPEGSLPSSWRAGIEAAVKLGVPAVIAMGVVWWMGMMLTARIDRIVERLDQHDKSTAELVSHLNSDAQQAWRLVAISQRICINTSKTDQDRMSCVTSEGGR